MNIKQKNNVLDEMIDPLATPAEQKAAGVPVQPLPAFLARVQALLINVAACKGRAAWLGRLRRGAEREFPGSSPPPPDDFGREIDLLAHVGIFPAVEQGQLTLERLAALTRDPEALQRAHAALTMDWTEPANTATWSDGSSAEADTVALPGVLPRGGTELILSGRIDDFERWLRPLLPLILDHVRLPSQADQIEAIWDLIHSRLAEVDGSPGKRLRDRFPHWLDDFAQGRPGQMSRPFNLDEFETSLELDYRMLQETLASRRGAEPAWASKFRDLARKQNLPNSQRLLLLQLPASFGPAPGLPAFRRDLLAEVVRRRHEAMSMLR